MEAAATAVLSSRLRAHAGVSCTVDCSLPGLLAGRVEAARITGVGWQSRQNLTCRSLDFRVGAAALDGGALTRGMLLLSASARGSGDVVFTARDFGNFLAHPLLVAAAARAVAGRRFAFAPDSVVFDAAAAAVRFAGAFDGARYACTLRPPPAPGGAVAVLAAGGPAAEVVAASLQRFFATLRIDLEGTRLSYADMELSPDGRTLRLALALEVTRFPRADFAF